MAAGLLNSACITIFWQDDCRGSTSRDDFSDMPALARQMTIEIRGLS
jgi:hypothetical protein